MLFIHYRKISITLSWLISLLIAFSAFVLAEFGGPWWIFVLCGLWLWSFGLPTTVSFVFLAALWGNLPIVGTPSLMAFAIWAVTLSLFSQAVFFRATGKIVTYWRNR